MHLALTPSRRALVAVVTAAIVAALVAGPRTLAAGATGSWTQQAPHGAPAAPPPYVEIQCPTASVCYALGSPQSAPLTAHPVLDTTTDGGVTWTQQQLDTEPYNWPDTAPLSCPAVNVCYLLVSAHRPGAVSGIWATVDGGRSWTKHDLGAGVDPEQISCPGVTDCYAIAFVGGGAKQLPVDNLLVTRDGGKTWTSRVPSVSYQPLQVFTCPGPNDCYLAGLLVGAPGPGSNFNPAMATTHDGGKTWHLGPSGQFSALACASVQRCYAAGEPGFLMTADGGSTWTRRTMPVPNVVGGSYPLACPDALTCYMPFAGAIWRTRDGGATWEQGSGDGWPFIGLACPATSVCYAVGVSAKVVKTTDGHTWAESTPFTRNWLYAIACASAQACAAVGYAGTVLTTSDRGATWVRRSSGEGLSLTSIACPSARVCFAGTGGYAYGAPDYPLLKSTDAGQTWVGEDRSANPVAVASVACPRADLCLAAAMKAKNANPSTPMVPVVLRTSNGGRTWTDVRVPSPLTSIACATAHRCVAVGGVAPCTGDFVSRQAGGPCSVRGWLYTTSDAGLHWRRTWAAAGRDLLSVTCASATQCYAGGFWVWGRSADGGKTWSIHTQRKFPVTPEPAPSLGAPADFVRSISCPSATTCWAIAGHLADANGLPVRTTDGGRTWQVVSRNVPPFDPNSGSGGLAALACPAQDRCYAVGGAGLVMAYAP